MAVPALVQHVLWSCTAETNNAIQLIIDEPTLSGNMLRLRLVYGSSATISSIVDNVGNTWPTTPDVSVTDTDNVVTVGYFHVFGATAGVTKITVTFSASQGNFTASFQEWYNIATSSAIDGTAASNFNLGVSSEGGLQQVAPGSYVPSTSGDLIFCDATDTGSSGGYGGGSMAGDGYCQMFPDPAFTMAQVDLLMAHFSSYQIQPAAMTVTPVPSVLSQFLNGGWSAICYGVKTASAGTAPTALPRIIGTYHYRLGVPAGADSVCPLQFPTYGTTLVVTASDPWDSTNMTSLAGAVMGTGTVTSSADGDAQVSYKTQVVASQNETLYLGVDDVASHQYYQGIIYDCIGLGNYDTIEALQDTTGFGPGDSAPAVDITPGVSAGMAFCTMGLGTGPPNAIVTPSGGIMLSTVYTGETDASNMDNGDFYAFYQFTSNAQQAWVCYDTEASSDYDCKVITFGLGPVITAQPANQAAYPGQQVTFSVTGSASSGGGSLSYQWYRNGSAVSGATSSSYSFVPNWSADLGASWYCLVSDGNGAVQSASAQFTPAYESAFPSFPLLGGYGGAVGTQSAPVSAIGYVQLNACEIGDEDFPSELNVKFWF